MAKADENKMKKDKASCWILDAAPVGKEYGSPDCEYDQTESRTRKALSVDELSDEDIDQIEQSKMSSEHKHLNDEINNE